MDFQRFATTSLLLILIQSVNIAQSTDYDSLEYGFYIYRTETRLSVGVNYQQTCFAKINQREACLLFGNECPEIHIVWTLPLKLKQTQQKGLDIRTNIVANKIVLSSATDTIVYRSTLSISNLGLIHRGVYGCVLKYIDVKSRKMKEIASNRFELEVNGGTTGNLCDFNDQCESTQCYSRRCVCSETSPVFSDHNGQCYEVAMLNETCEISEQCRFFSNKKMFCGCLQKENNCQKVCRCVDRYIATTVGLSGPQCLPSVKLGGKCSFTDQCKAMDENTFCGFSGVCECSYGKYCSQPKSSSCTSKYNCTAIEFCHENICREKKDVGESCDFDAECLSGDRNSFCDKNVCVCKANFKISSRNKCILHEECHSHSDCSVSKSFCEHGFCKRGTKLGGKCVDAIECQANDKKSYCSTNNVCECISHFTRKTKGKEEICVSKDYCENDKDCRERSRSSCLNNTCNYIIKLYEKCQSTQECIASNYYSICDSKLRVCRCAHGFESNNGICEISSCQNDDQCLRLNEKWFCSNSKCSCFNGYTLSKYGICVLESKEPKDEDGKVPNWVYIMIFVAVPAIIGILFVTIVVVICEITRKQRYSRRAALQQHSQSVYSIS